MIAHAKSRLIPDRSKQATDRLLVGIIHGPDGVHHVVASPSRRILMKTLALWAAGQAVQKLSAEESDQIADLVREARYVPAIRRYLTLVRRRWDFESLTVERVDVAQDSL